VPFINLEKNMVKAGQATYDDMTHAHCTLDNWGCKHTLRICNTFCFSTTTTVTRTRLNVTLYVQSVCLSVCLSCWRHTICNPEVHKELQSAW